MRKRTAIGLIVAAVVIISATAVLSHPAWRGGRLQEWDRDELVTLKGNITDAERPVIKLVADGQEYILHPGPYWYWREKGYTLDKDQEVEVTGVVEEFEGVLYVYPQTIKADGKVIELADEDGVPVWSGHRGGRGWHGPGQMHGWRGYGHGWHGPGQMHGGGGYGRGGGRYGYGRPGC